MLCRMFEEVGFGRCHAVEGQHVPTVMERERFCHNGGQSCPILAVYRGLGQPMDMDTYMDTWSRPPSERSHSGCEMRKA